MRWLTESGTQLLTQLMWCGSGCAAGAAAIATALIYQQPASVTLAIVGAVLALDAGALWLVCRREALMVVAFAGLVGAFCGVIGVVATDTAPWLATALGLWLLGSAWAILGWLYPEPLGTSMLVGATLALIAPALAVHDAGWVYVVGIATAGTAMAASVPLRNVVLAAFGSCAMFCYITAVVLRYANRSLGVSESLVIIGVVLIGLAIVTVGLRRATRPTTTLKAPPDHIEPKIEPEREPEREANTCST
ncbi:MAG TPA: hypothetical protein VN695_16000 [Streptosporangiaceae bacterium]|nr:hypothetical protein [Streptosporangiaceae bacterium]